MSVWRSWHLNVYTEHHVIHECSSANCRFTAPKFSKYKIILNETKNQFLTASIVLINNETMYMLTIDKENNEILLEQIKLISNIQYYTFHKLIRLPEYLEFDHYSPIESGTRILNKLLSLNFIF